MRSLRVLLIVLLVAAPGARPLAETHPPPPPPFRVIINPQNPSNSADRKFVVDAFLKKVTRWGDLYAIQPVDLPADSPVRELFSQEVLRRSVAAVKIFWQQMVFSGRDVPPPELDSDRQVVQYVLKVPGAIGYVSGAADLQGAKVLVVR